MSSPTRGADAMTYVTLFLPRGRFGLMLATGPNGKPTEDGGPWMCEYTIPNHERETYSRFDIMSEASRNAATILWRHVKQDAPGIFLEARKRGWTVC